LNAVAPLPNGGLVASSNYRRGDPDARARGHAGKNSGEVWEWHATGGWTIIPGSEAPGPNGVEVSPDGAVLYVNLWPVRKIMRLSRGRVPVQRDEVDVPFHPDNIRWQTDGTLLSAGHYAATIQRANECLRTMCGDAAAKVARLDPRSMSVRIVVEYPSTDVFFGATAALQIQREIWIGSVRGDRIARYPVD
jgi:sugar lactone lactonase YvrE